MLTVLATADYMKIGCDPKMFFDLNGEPYRLVEDDRDGPVDVLLTYPWYRRVEADQLRAQYRHQIAVELDLWHGFESCIAFYNQLGNYQDNNYMITVAGTDSTVNNPNIMPLEFSFNRFKAYYSQFPFSPGWIPYYHNGSYSFIVPRLTDGSNKTKIFVAPVSTINARKDHPVRARIAVAELIRQHYYHLGHMSDYSEQHPDDYLHSHYVFPTMDNVNWIKSQPIKPTKIFYGVPPHNAYYADTFISIFGETMESGTTQVITEKTYDPLVKGHFILPFSTPHFLRMVRDRGILLPDFIDYSYDTMEDFDQRLAAWLAEVRRLLSMPIEHWRELYKKNFDLLYANQVWMWRRDYDRIDIRALIAKSNT
jgi:hypothetical protein